MKPAVSYSRFSTPEQAKGRSFARQIERAEAYCKANKLKLLPDHFHDAGISARQGKNQKKALGVLLEALRSEEIPTPVVVIVESIDRFSRQAPFDAIDIVKDILKTGAEIVTLEDSIHYTSESIRKQGWQLQILISHMQRAHNESEQKSIRVRDAWQDLKKKARTEKTPITNRIPFWLEVRGGKIEPIDARVEVVDKIFRLRASGLGATRILRELGKNLKPWGKGKKWHTSYVQKILHNRAVLGEYQPYERTEAGRLKEGEPIPGFFRQVISRELWEKAQAGLSRGRTGGSGKHTGKISNLFSGLVYSTEGEKLHYTNKKSGTDWQYLSDSNGTVWQYDAFEKFFFMVISQKGLLAKIRLNKIQDKAVDDAIEALLKEKEDINMQAKNVAAEIARRKGKALPAVHDLADELSDRLEAIELEVKQLQQKRKSAGGFEKLTGEETRERLRGIIRQFIKRIVVGKNYDGFRLEFRNGKTVDINSYKELVMDFRDTHLPEPA